MSDDEPTPEQTDNAIRVALHSGPRTHKGYCNLDDNHQGQCWSADKESEMNEHEPNKWRKKPVTITAQRMAEAFSVETLEGTMRGGAGDWLITGVNGEQYPCKDDIFRKTYEPEGA